MFLTVPKGHPIQEITAPTIRNGLNRCTMCRTHRAGQAWWLMDNISDWKILDIKKDYKPRCYSVQLENLVL